MEIKSRYVTTNGIRMHVSEQGSGPLVVLCHGFPEGWYSWRHQMQALAEAGFWAVAPDQRGYGETDRPEAIDAYTLCHLVGDIVGLVRALDRDKAFIFGHDWGAPVAWHCALLRPDIFHSLGLLSVPYIANFWGGPKPTEVMRMMFGGKVFYQYYFQEPGKAERDLEEDVRTALRRMYYSASGDPPPQKRWRFVMEPSDRLMDTVFEPDAMPPWFSEQDLDFYTQEFQKSGFRGGLNWYRNLDRDSELLAFLSGAKILQPAVFVAGEADPVIAMYRDAFDSMEENLPNLRGKHLLPGAGHWIQQERPEVVSRLFLDFVKRRQSEL